MRKLLGLIAWVVCVSCTQQDMTGPDGNIRVKLGVNGSGQLSYSIQLGSKTVIRESPLGIIVDGDTLGIHTVLTSTGKRRINETYPIRGFHTTATNSANEYRYKVESGNSGFDLQFRIFNDGVAFRYCMEVPDSCRINGELSSFHIPAGLPVWFFERPNHWKLKSYAGNWIQTFSDSLFSISPTGPVQGMPLVFELGENGYMALAEAALYNYSGMRLKAFPDASLVADFTEEDGFTVAGEIITPWRVIILAKDLDELVNTDILTNLNPAPDKTLFPDTSWILPGRSVWSWWSDKEGYMSLPYEKQFIDYAAELGFEYTLLDEGWEKWENKWTDLRKICHYARMKNIGVFVWKHSNEIIDKGEDYQVMRMFLDSIKTCGVSGIKIDFMNGETKKIIDFDIKALELCAERRLLVNFHGCQKPSGESRTYPNEITREGIRGLELNRMNKHLSSSHNVALIFTRAILNNSDYTPIGFSDPGNTTWAHQLATAYAYTSPLLVMGEDPSFILKDSLLSRIVPLIKTLPTVWDETRVLPGSTIGSTAILARRKGNEWYLVALNGNQSATFDMETGFLETGKWNAFVVADQEDEDFYFKTDSLCIEAGESFPIHLNAHGGFVAKFTPL